MKNEKATYSGRHYVSPAIEIRPFLSLDIITTSDTTSGNHDPNAGEWDLNEGD